MPDIFEDFKDVLGEKPDIKRDFSSVLGEAETTPIGNPPPQSLFDPISAGISPVQGANFVPDPSSRPIAELQQGALEDIDRFFGVPGSLDEAGIEQVPRGIARAGVGAVGFLPSLGERLIRPPEGQSTFDVVGEEASGLVGMLGRFPLQMRLLALKSLGADPNKALNPADQALMSLTERITGKTFGEFNKELEQGLLQAPEEPLFSASIVSGGLRGGAKLTKKLQTAKTPELLTKKREISDKIVRKETPRTLDDLAAQTKETVRPKISTEIKQTQKRQTGLPDKVPTNVIKEAPKPTVEKVVVPDVATQATDVSVGSSGGVKVVGKKTSKIKVPKARPKSDLQAQASTPIEVADRFLTITRERKARVYESHLKADKWEKNFKEVEREDAGALVEGIENLRTGKKPKPTARLQSLVNDYRFVQEKARLDVNESLKNIEGDQYISFLEDYLPHFYTGKIKNAVGKWMKDSPNSKKRKLPTLKEAVDIGLTPLSQDVSLLYRIWSDINWKVAANKQIADLFKRSRDGEGNPITKAGDKPAPDWVRFDHPAIARVWGRKTADGKVILQKGGVWVHPDYVKIAKQAFDDPLSTRGKIGKAFDNINAAAKHGELLLSGFHAIALMESGQAVLARGKNPFRGLFLAGKDAQRLSDKRFILSFRGGKRFQEANPEAVMDFIRDGLELRTASADIGAGILSRSLKKLEVKSRTLGGAGRVFSHFPRKLRQGIDLLNKGLWEQIHEGYKIASHYDILQRELPRIPDNASAGVRQKVRETIAEGINDAFGGQEWESKFWLTPQGLQYARRAFLAPDWTLSNIRIAGRGLKNIKDPIERRMWITYWRNMSLSVAGTIQAMNYWSTGHFTWDNEIDHKMDIDYTRLRRQIDKVLGKKPDKRRHYVRIAKQAREILSWFENPLAIAGSKASPLVRETFKQATGHQAGSGFQAEWTRERQQFWESIPNRIKSMANLFTPFSLRGNQFAFSLPASKGMSNFKAIRAFQRALDAKEWIVFGKHVKKEDAIREIAQAAKDNGLDVKQLYTAAVGSVRGKYYDRYFKALEDEDMKKAHEIALILRDLGATEKNVRQSAKRRGLLK